MEKHAWKEKNPCAQRWWIWGSMETTKFVKINWRFRKSLNLGILETVESNERFAGAGSSSIGKANARIDEAKKWNNSGVGPEYLSAHLFCCDVQFNQQHPSVPLSKKMEKHCVLVSSQNLVWRKLLHFEALFRLSRWHLRSFQVYPDLFCCHLLLDIDGGTMWCYPKSNRCPQLFFHHIFSIVFPVVFLFFPKFLPYWFPVFFLIFAIVFSQVSPLFSSLRASLVVSSHSSNIALSPLLSAPFSRCCHPCLLPPFSPYVPAYFLPCVYPWVFPFVLFGFFPIFALCSSLLLLACSSACYFLPYVLPYGVSYAIPCCLLCSLRFFQTWSSSSTSEKS